MPDISGIFSSVKPVPDLFDSEREATQALAVQLGDMLYPASLPSKTQTREIVLVARQIVRNVAAMVLEDWIE
jgi:hypothetical protein